MRGRRGLQLSVDLAEIVSTSNSVAGTASRLEKVAALAECLQRLPPGDVAVAVAFLSGDLPRGRVGVAWRSVQAMDRVPPADRPTLTLEDVDATLVGLAGDGPRAAREQRLEGLFARATAAEQQFLGRLLVGELRQGAQEGVVVEAIARAAGVPAEAVRRAVMLRGDPGAIARVALTAGETGLAGVRLELFRPVRPMLAAATADPATLFARHQTLALDWKLDGARVQVHRDGGEVRVYSRRLNDVTDAVPEVVAAIAAVPATRLVLDGEVVALGDDGRPAPFQVTMRRFGQRRDVARLRRELPVVPFFFDCLHVDGVDLIDRPQHERVAAMDRVLPASLRVPTTIATDAAALEAFLAQALAAGHEGVVAKNRDAAYAAGRRGGDWIKIKPAHTLDLVVLAAEWGSGRRRGLLSNLHLGARDPAGGGHVMLGKTFKGLTDAMLAWQTEHLQELELRRDEWTVWVQPRLVVEIAFDGVQASPRYPGGLALRFARVKAHRPDKPASEADTIDTVREIYDRQAPVPETRGDPGLWDSHPW